MANKNFCDICGKEIKDYLDSNRIRFEKKGGEFEYEEELNKLEINKMPKNLDLCCNCMGKIERKTKQLKEEEKIKEEENKY